MQEVLFLPHFRLLCNGLALVCTRFVVKRTAPEGVVSLASSPSPNYVTTACVL